MPSNADGRVVALVCDDELYVKPTDAGRSFIGNVKEGMPYPGAKPWLLISGDQCEDGEWLSELIQLTAKALPPAKEKSSRTLKRTKPSKAKAASKPSRGAAATRVAPVAAKRKSAAKAKPGAKAKSRKR